MTVRLRPEERGRGQQEGVQHPELIGGEEDQQLAPGAGGERGPQHRGEAGGTLDPPGGPASHRSSCSDVTAARPWMLNRIQLGPEATSPLLWGWISKQWRVYS